MNNELLVTLLSAGVIASAVEGLFSIVIALKNNKLIMKQNHNDHVFELQKIQYEQLSKAYDDLLKVLPEETRVSHILTNTNVAQPELSIEERVAEMEKIGKAASDEERILYNHYKNYSHLLRDEQNQIIEEIIKKHDELAEKQDIMWLETLVEFEDTYSKQVRERLSELTKIA